MLSKPVNLIVARRNWNIACWLMKVGRSIEAAGERLEAANDRAAARAGLDLKEVYYVELAG